MVCLHFHITIMLMLKWQNIVCEFLLDSHTDEIALLSIFNSIDKDPGNKNNTQIIISKKNLSTLFVNGELCLRILKSGGFGMNIFDFEAMDARVADFDSDTDTDTDPLCYSGT